MALPPCYTPPVTQVALLPRLRRYNFYHADGNGRDSFIAHASAHQNESFNYVPKAPEMAGRAGEGCNPRGGGSVVAAEPETEEGTAEVRTEEHATELGAELGAERGAELGAKLRATR